VPRRDAASAILRVLVVDDSAFVRKVVSQMLTRSPFLEVVGTARDGEEALEMTERLSPDVVTLDLMMPRMDGLEYLRQQMAKRPIPVVVCSISHESGAAAVEALELGAVEFVQKPTALATDRVYEIAAELVAKVKAAAARATNADIVTIGISTGGPQALRHLIPLFPADFPVPIAVVLHMPVGYTAMYAARLNDISPLHVVEAGNNEAVTPGVMYLAPAGQHLSFLRGEDGGVRTHLDLAPADTQHRPSVDVLFRSAAEVYGGRVLGVVMTGMGNDGLVGSAHVQAKGGRILTEAESSCVVYGMPRSVVEAGVSDRVATLQDMATAITEMI
jgi:two-component system chemotaxis response regulator CheB